MRCLHTAWAAFRNNRLQMLLNRIECARQQRLWTVGERASTSPTHSATYAMIRSLNFLFYVFSRAPFFAQLPPLRAVLFYVRPGQLNTYTETYTSLCCALT